MYYSKRGREGCPLCLSLHILQQSLKRLLVSLVVFPPGEVTDMFSTENSRLPRLSSLLYRVIQGNGKKHLTAALFFFLQGGFYLMLHPGTRNRMRREHQQELIIVADGLIHALASLVCTLHLFWGKPAAQPLVAPIESFGLPPRHPFGERATPRRLLEDPLRVAGVREYVRGDDPRRIHWKASARAGELRSKIYEPSSQYRLLMLLDINSYPEPWMGLDPEIQELSIAAAASLALWALDRGYAVGLIANSLMMGLSGEDATGDDERAPLSATAVQAFIHRVRVPLATGSAQREQLLSALGRLLPYFGSPMDALIEAERFALPIGTTVVLVSAAAALRESTVESLVDLRTHGAVVHLALTGDPDGKVGAETYDMPVHHLGGREVWRELTRSIGDESNDTIGRSATSLHLD
jgi:hypothetical protein